MTFIWMIFCCIIVYYTIKFYKFVTHFRDQGIVCQYFVWDWIIYEFPTFLEKHALNKPKIFGSVNGVNHLLIVNDINVYKEISTKEAYKYPIRAGFHVGGDIMESLFFMDADENWKRVRSIVSPAFSSGKLRAMCSPIEAISDKLIEHLKPFAESGQEFDIRRLFDGFTIDVISRCAYGIELDSINQPDHPVIVNAKNVLNINAGIKHLICGMFPGIARFLGLEYFDPNSTKFFDKLTHQIIEKRLKDNNYEQCNDLVALMMHEYVPDKNRSQIVKGLTKKEISGQGLIFYVAGQDTTNAAFNSAIYYLTHYPEWQDKIYEEIKRFKCDLSYDNLREMIVLDGFICEVLRLRPPLTVITRVSTDDGYLGNTNIFLKKGTQLVTHPYLIHRNPEYFRDPLEFLPERFINKEPETLTNFVPFGYGNRLCVGMRFAQNELRLGLAKFILNYRVQKTPNTKLEYFFGSPLLSPKNMFVTISRR